MPTLSSPTSQQIVVMTTCRAPVGFSVGLYLFNDAKRPSRHIGSPNTWWESWHRDNSQFQNGHCIINQSSSVAPLGHNEWIMTSSVVECMWSGEAGTWGKERVLSLGHKGAAFHFAWQFPRHLKLPTEYVIMIWAPSQYKDRLIYIWRFPC